MHIRHLLILCLLAPIFSFAVNEQLDAEPSNTVFFNIGTKKIPALVKHYKADNTRLMFYFHGYSSNKEAGINEITRLATSGYDVIAMDAPRHGERKDDALYKANTLTKDTIGAYVMEVIFEQATEVKQLISLFESKGYTEFAVSGVSMGGVTAYHVPLVSDKVTTVVAVLGSPDWTHFTPQSGMNSQQVLASETPNRFKAIDVFALNAELDTAVPPHYARKFIKDLQVENKSKVRRYKYLEVPEAGHFVSNEQWNGMWDEIDLWLAKN
jgi:pimeloyl-ACP methyl ester carboxylesterase